MTTRLQSKCANAKVLSSPNNGGSSSVDGSSALTLHEFDERIKKHSELLLNSLKKKLNKLREDFNKELHEMEAIWISKIKEVTITLSELSARIGKTEADLSSSTSEVISIGGSLKDLTKRIGVLERKEVAADAILFGIPECAGENLIQVFNKMCSTVECRPPQLRCAVRFRRSVDSSGLKPIILKFNSRYDRDLVLRCASKYRRKN